MQIKESLLRLILNDNVSSIKWLVIIFKYKIQIERHIADCGCRNSYFKWKFSYINGDWRTPAIIRHMTGAPLYWEAFSTCQLVLLSSVSNIMLNKCSNHMKTLRRGGGGGGKAREKIEARAKVPLTWSISVLFGRVNVKKCTIVYSTSHVWFGVRVDCRSPPWYKLLHSPAFRCH